MPVRLLSNYMKTLINRGYKRRKETEYSKELLETIVKDSVSTTECCRKLGIRPAGGNYKTLKDKFKKFDIDISHFTGKRGIED